VSGRLQVETDLDKLLATAADAFSQALGASSTRIQLITPDALLTHRMSDKTAYEDQPDFAHDTRSPDGER